MAGKHTIAALFAALILGIPVSAQVRTDTLEVKRVESDSLVRFMRSKCGTHIHFIKDKEDVATYSVKATAAEFEKKALAELKAKGYAVSRYDNRWFVLRGVAIAQASLPAGYFEENTAKATTDEYSQMQETENQMATFRNKVYEIGEFTKGRKGKATVRGYVRDISTGEPLVGISVYDDKTGAYCATDASGFYSVSLPIGSNKLNFSGFSLEDLALTLEVYNDGGLDVVMKEKITSLRAVVVSADARAAHRDSRLGTEKVRVSTIKVVPTAFGEADVLKVVLTLPGVKSVGEAATGFNVRGGASDQNLILFNGGTIYNPSHMFGLLSSFNTDVINDIELYKSSIPAEFGGRISSVLDIRSKEGNANKIGANIGLGLLTSRFEIDGPIKKGKTTFVLGGRTTYSNWILNMLPASSSYGGGKASFADINAGITHKFNDKNTLQAFAYWSTDQFSFANDTTFRYANLNASIKWRSHFAERHTLTLTAGLDNFKNELDNCNYDYSAYRFQSGIRQWYTKLGFTSNFGKHVLSYGVNGIAYQLNPGMMNPLGDASHFVADHLDNQTAQELALYLSDTWNVNDKLSFEYGTRLSGYHANTRSYFYPEARLSGKYSFTPVLSLKAGFNTMSQNIHMISNSTSVSPMDTWHLSSDRIRPQNGWQAASGLYWTVLGGQVDLSLEGYYKRMFHYVDYKSGATLVMNHNLEDDLVETTGKAYGVEFMAKKSTGKLNGWVSYTYSRALLREVEDRGVETINGGEWYNAPHDKPHDFKMVANYKFTHRYSMSVNLDYSTGRPMTVPIGMYKYNGSYCLAYSYRNAVRIPDYFRMDVAMNVEPSHYLKQLTHMSFTFGVYNVTGRKNAYSVYYTSSGYSGVEGHMLSVFACPIPYVNLNIKF